MQAGLGSVQKRLHGAYSGKYGILTPPKLNKIFILFNRIDLINPGSDHFPALTKSSVISYDLTKSPFC